MNQFGRAGSTDILEGRILRGGERDEKREGGTGVHLLGQFVVMLSQVPVCIQFLCILHGNICESYFSNLILLSQGDMP